MVLRKSLALLVLSALGLLPVGSLLCELSCADDAMPGQTAPGHHCQSSSRAAATIESADRCGTHALDQPAPALLRTAAQRALGGGPGAVSIAEPAAIVCRTLNPPDAPIVGPPFPPGFSILRI